MINAAMVGLGWWGKTLVEALADGSDVMRFTTLTTRTVSPYLSPKNCITSLRDFTSA